MFKQCASCGFVEEYKRYKNNYNICRKCGYYGTLNSYERITMVVDEGTFDEMDGEIGFHDAISFPGYYEKYNIAVEKTGIKEAIVIGKGQIHGRDVLLGVMDSRFMMSSMGSGVGEKVTRLFEEAIRTKCPVIIFSASGGARMQEGVIALMRKALRLMKQAEKFDRPIITIIDTPGAYPGADAEKRGQAEVIAKNLYEMPFIRGLVFFLKTANFQIYVINMR